MSYGTTPQGFIRKPYSVILSELQEEARSGDYFGPDIDLSDANFVGVLLKLMAWALDRQWQRMEDAYYAIDIDAAEGVALNRLVALGLISRSDAQYAITDLLFEGDPDTPIPAGTQVETDQNVVFSTVSFVKTDTEGIAAVQATCTEAGDIGNVPENSINNIKNPVSGITSVTNTVDAIGGRGIETDPELRVRYKSISLSSGSSLDAIISRVNLLPSIEEVVGFENTFNYEHNSLPPNSIEIVVRGGLVSDIANAIFSKKPAGIYTHGDISHEIIDTQGKTHIIKFSRPEELNIYIRAILTTEYVFNGNKEALIRQAIISHIDSLSIGTSVYDWRISSLLVEIDGLINVDVFMGISELDISYNSIDATPRQNITVDEAGIFIEYV
jgi:uncharacterized phage protein gp47/JayE